MTELTIDFTDGTATATYVDWDIVVGLPGPSGPPGEGGGGGAGLSDWTDLGNLGATETITGDDDTFVRVKGTLDQACTITLTLVDNQQIDLIVEQGGVGAFAATFAGVDSWVTSDGNAPDTTSRAVGEFDRFYFEQADGVAIGYWITDDSTGTAPVVVAPVDLDRTASTDRIISGKRTADATYRWTIDADGVFRSGTGATAPVLSLVTHATSTTVGRHAGRDDVPGTPTYSTAVGVEALAANTTALYNTAVGYRVLRTQTTGAAYNTGIGALALQNVTTGDENTAIGYNAAAQMQTGTWNIAIGTGALRSCTGGSANMAIGTGSLEYATGSSSTAVGFTALGGVTSGAGNVGIGWGALYAPNAVYANNTTTGAYQVGIGYEVGSASTTQHARAVAIGYHALFDGVNAVAIGPYTTAGAAGAVAIGADSSGGGATTTTANEIKLGTANHAVTVIGNASVGGAAKTVGFYGSAGVAKQVGVAVTAAGIHAALVALNLIAA